MKLQAEVVRLKEENKTLKRDRKNLQAQLDANTCKFQSLKNKFLTYLQKLLNPPLLIKREKTGQVERKAPQLTSPDPSDSSDSSESDSVSSTEKTKKKKKKSTKKKSKKVCEC